MTKPLLLFAFANEPDPGKGGLERRHLRHLSEERRQIEFAMKQARDEGVCDPVFITDSTFEMIDKVFEAFDKEVAIFHFGGHANSFELLLQSEEGEHAPAHGVAMANYLGQYTGLALVFLNGCSTRAQVSSLHAAGISVVLATSRAIDDQLASYFASRFYSHLGRGVSVRSAFERAAAAAKVKRNNDPKDAYRDLIAEDPVDSFLRHELDWPWALYVAPGADASLEWSLTEAAGDPTFGLPPVPRGVLRSQAEGPYLGLRPFEKKHAELFFGRGSDIRALYEWFTAGDDSPPILVLHGQSGVGKSSLLEAGFLPRLKEICDPRIRRRHSQEGLLRTFEALLGGGMDGDLHRAWIETEHTLGRPLLVVLDQVEEVLTQPLSNLPTELDDFIGALVAIFRRLDRLPKGKLILGLRKDYQPEFEDQLKKAKLHRAEHFLQPLSREGVVEAITGPARNARLRKRFGLEIAPPDEGDEPLPEAIADELRRDPNSPIAPMLQVLLEKMWKAINDKASRIPNQALIEELGKMDVGGFLERLEVGAETTERRFDRALFEEVARPGEGGILDSYLDEQLDALASWKKDLSNSGLFLDFLGFHTSRLGTARARSWRELRESYAHQESLLLVLVERLKKLRLLAEEQGRTTETNGEAARVSRLAHDTLAPLVRIRLEGSEAPGQRARSILESRTKHWGDGHTGPVLNDDELRIVELGASGMRVPSPSERGLLEESRRLRRIRSAVLSHPDPVVPALIVPALEAYPGYSDRARLARLAADRPIPTAVLRGHAGAVRVASFSPDGERVLTTAEDGTARIWRADGLGDPAVLRGDNAKITSAAFSPNSGQVVTGRSDGVTQVWRADGSTCADLGSHEDSVKSASFSPDGERVLTASADGTARVWRADRTGDYIPLRGRSVYSSGESVFRGSPMICAKFSPDGQLVLTFNEGHQEARVWRVDGSGDFWLEGHQEKLTSASFSPDGEMIVTTSEDYTARVWRADGTGKPVVLHGHTHWVNGAGFSPDSKHVVTASYDGTVGFWVADGTGRHFLRVGDGGLLSGVRSVNFSPDGSRLVTTSLGDLFARILWFVVDDGIAERVVLLPGTVGSIVDASFSPDGKRVVTACTDGTARVWRADGAGDPVILRGLDGYPSVGDISPDGKRVVTDWQNDAIDEDPALEARVWQTDRPGDSIMFGGDDHDIVQLDGHDRPVYLVAFSPDGNRVITVDETYTLRVWRADALGDPVICRGHEDSVHTVKFSPDGSRVVTASEDGTARVWQADGTGDPVILRHKKESAGRGILTDLVVSVPVNSAEFSPDGGRVVTASDDHTARVWRADDPDGSIPLDGHEGDVNSAEFSSDGRRVVTASVDGTARVWQADGRSEPVNLSGHECTVWGAKFSPDGERVVTVSSDGTARVWQADGGGEPVILRVDGVKHAKFSPKGSRVVTGSEDGTVCVWRADGFGEPLIMPGRKTGWEHGVGSVTFSPDGKRVFAVSDFMARIWRIEWESLVQYLKSSTTACLTPTQRVDLLGESLDEARARYEECERKYGRTPRTDGEQ